MRKAASSAFAALILFGVTVAHAGGWAVITVTEVPEYVVTGQPVTVTYAVRQHGRHLLSNLEGRVAASRTGGIVSVASKAASEEGHYSATVTLPASGDWIVSIDSGFGGRGVTRVPLMAIEPGAAAPVVSDRARGGRLFVAKGCVTCHVDIRIGPDLTAKRYRSEYLRTFLAGRSPVRPSKPEGFDMPDLGLQEHEITLLVAYITATRSRS
jgi:hypothetical protein